LLELLFLNVSSGTFIHFCEVKGYSKINASSSEKLITTSLVQESPAISKTILFPSIDNLHSLTYEPVAV
jgi:hypothetical protein